MSFLFPPGPVSRRVPNVSDIEIGDSAIWHQQNKCVPRTPLSLRQHFMKVDLMTSKWGPDGNG